VVDGAANGEQWEVIDKSLKDDPEVEQSVIAVVILAILVVLVVVVVGK
jgi:hypothetical protein